MSGKRPAEALDPPQKKRSRFGPAVVPQNGLQAPPQTAAAVQNGSTAPPGISGIKSELHARTEALKAKLQALKVRFPAKTIPLEKMPTSECYCILDWAQLIKER